MADRTRGENQFTRDGPRDDYYDDERDRPQNDDDLDFEDDMEPNESHMEDEQNLQYQKDQNLEQFNPVIQPAFFYLGISGHIESGEFRDLDGLALKFDFVAGDHWRLTKGNESGISQHSFKSQGMNKRIVWNFPFELTYSSLNVSGWP